MRLAILGGGGCFGMNLSRRALTAGHEVLAIGRSPMKSACFSLDLAHPKNGYEYKQIHVVDQLDSLMETLHEWRPEVVVNFAAQGEGAVSFDPRTYGLFYRTNTQGVVSLVARLRDAMWLKRYIHVGTSELYGSVTKPSKESDPLIPSSPYAASKAGGDLHLIAEGKRFPWNIIRPSNSYTPGQQLHRLIPRAMLMAVSGGLLELHGGGKAEKSYIHADDLSRAILLVADKAPTQEIYNCGPELPISMIDLVHGCAKACGVLMQKFVTIGPEREGQDGRYWLDSSKLLSLGWSPTVNMIGGLFGMYSWVNAYKPELLAEIRPYRLAA